MVASTTARFDDYLQLAHYWRMLEAVGRAPAGNPTGFIVGRDSLPELSESGFIATWLDLGAPVFRTYSRSSGTKMRTALQRYDHEHGFRLKVARASAAREPALVEPVFTSECESCPRLEHCESLTDPDVASRNITSGRLSVREWKALAAAGIIGVGGPR